MALPTIRLVLTVALTLSLPLAAHGKHDVDYDTIRFYTKNSKPEQVGAYAFSPNGRYLALSFSSRNLGSKSGVSIVDLEKQELTKQTGSFSFFTLAFSSNSQKILGVGGYAGIQLIDVATGSIQRYKNLPSDSGKIGIGFREKNGKLLITKIVDRFNPTIGDQIKVGDEILAINEGEKPTRYDDRREWKMLAGKPLKKALEMITGKPGSWVQLRLARRGQSDPIDVSVQRRWPANSNRSIPTSGECLTLAVDHGVLQFRSADTMQLSAFTSLRDIKRSGQYVVSPDGKRFGALAQVVNGRKFCVEVHNLRSGKLEQSTILDTPNYRHMRFSPDSSQVLVGTRDTIEVFDIRSAQWQEPVMLTPSDNVDAGRIVTRKIPLGFGLPGGLYTTARDVVYAKPAVLALFDVSPNGTLAVGSETGEIVLASLETKERFGLVGDNILGAKPEMIEFSPTGKHLVAYAKGVLHIFELGEAAANSEIVTGQSESAGVTSQ